VIGTTGSLRARVLLLALSVLAGAGCTPSAPPAAVAPAAGGVVALLDCTSKACGSDQNCSMLRIARKILGGNILRVMEQVERGAQR
jgi:hypothetical protein